MINFSDYNAASVTNFAFPYLYNPITATPTDWSYVDSKDFEYADNLSILGLVSVAINVWTYRGICAEFDDAVLARTAREEAEAEAALA